MKKDRLENYAGLERLKAGAASVQKDPVQKGDRLEYNSRGYITRIFRDGKPLYWVGQIIRYTPDGDEVVVLNISVTHEPGRIDEDELECEGFTDKESFGEAFGGAYGFERLWKPAWRIRCGVNKIISVSEMPGGQGTEVAG